MPGGEYSRRAPNPIGTAGSRAQFSSRRSFCVTVEESFARESGKECAAPTAASFGSNHGDFDQQTGIGQLGLDAGPAWQVLALGPGVPGLVHGVTQADVGDPDGGRYHLGLVGAAQLQEAVDLLENLSGLALGI